MYTAASVAVCLNVSTFYSVYLLNFYHLSLLMSACELVRMHLFSVQQELSVCYLVAQ